MHLCGFSFLDCILRRHCCVDSCIHFRLSVHWAVPTSVSGVSWNIRGFVVLFILWEFHMRMQCTLMTLIPQGSASNLCCPHVHDCGTTSNLIFLFSLVVHGSLFRDLPYLKSYFCFKCLIVHPIWLCFFYYPSAHVIFYVSSQFMLLVRVSSWPHSFFTKPCLHIPDCLLSYDFSNHWVRAHVKVVRILLQSTPFSQCQTHTLIWIYYPSLSAPEITFYSSSHPGLLHGLKCLSFAYTSNCCLF